MVKKIAALLGLVLLVAAVPASGQSRTAVGVNEAFSAAALPPKDGAVTALRLYLDGVRVGSDVAVTGPEEVTFSVPGIPTAGAHRLEVSAVNDFGESARSGLAFWAGPPPAPGLPRIQVVNTQVFEQVPSENGIGLRLVSSRTDVSEVK
jgi:hypothetical protein